jgi:hypothetical protein
MSAGALNVNVACLACDGTRPCAQCRAMGKTLSGAGHRVHRSSRYAALRAAADGTYGFSACVMPLTSGERSVADAIVALLPDARVAIATDDATVLPEKLPEGFVSFPRADFLAGRLPREWLDALSRNVPSNNALSTNVAPERSSGRSLRSDATRRLRAIATTHRTMELDARALLADELAWYRASGIGFALVSMRFGGLHQGSKQTVAASLRAGDSVAVEDGNLVIVLPAADAPLAEQICARVVKRLLKARRDLKARDVKVGIAVCPSDGDDGLSLLATANERA